RGPVTRATRTKCLVQKEGTATRFRPGNESFRKIAQKAERRRDVCLCRPTTAITRRRNRGRSRSLCIRARWLLVVGFSAHAIVDAVASTMAGADRLSGRRRRNGCAVACARRVVGGVFDRGFLNLAAP